MNNEDRSAPMTRGAATEIAATAETSAPNRSTLNNSVLLTLYYVMDSGLLFTLTLVLARYLGVANFGKLSFALCYGLVLYTVSDPGISLALTKFVARNAHPHNAWIHDGFSLRVLLVIGACLLGLAPMPFNSYLKANVLLFVPVIWSEQVRGLTLTYCALFRAFQAMIYETVVVGVERVSVLTAVFFLLRGNHDLFVVGAAFLGGRCLSFAVAALIFHLRFARLRMSVRPQMTRTLLREGAPLGVLVLAERLNVYFAPLALTIITGEYAAGLFQAAFKIVTFPLLLCGVVGGSLFPAMSAAFQDRERVRKLYCYGVRVLWHLLLPGAVVTLVFAPQVLRIIFGPAFEPAAPILRVLTPYYVLYGLITVSYYLMPAINHQSTAMNLSLASIAVNLTVTTLMTAYFGALGAALGLFLTALIFAVSYWRCAARIGFRLLTMRQDLYQWGGFLVTALVCLFVHNALPVKKWFELLLACGAIVLFYGAVLISTRSLLPEEVQVLSDLKSNLLR